MPFTAQEISNAGKAALDFYMKNKPIDQIAVERPFLKKLMAMSKDFPGAKQYIVEQLRKSYGSNFQWFYGDQQVTYNKRQTLEQANYPWRGCHDGFSLNEDELLQNGITLIEGKGGKNSEAERMQLTDLLQENIEVLRLGFEEKFDLELHQDGTQDVDALAGLESIVSLTPAVGVTGGLDRATYTWWRNNAITNLNTTAGDPLNVITNMEIQWRKCARNGGRIDYIMAGSSFIDSFRKAAKDEITRYTILSVNGQAPNLDPATGNANPVDSGLHFHGVPIIWNPVFEDLDALLAPGTPWEKRCYMLNCKHIRLRPAKGHNMITRTPPRVYDRYAYYWGLTWKGGLCANRLSAHSVLAMA